MSAAQWQTDVLGEPYLVETFELRPDAEGAVEANLVHLPPAAPTRRAVLHVHGFADYFFHTEYASWWHDRGYAFYALDLRKYGRSLREHQRPNMVLDLQEYDEELDAAWAAITERDGHDHVVLSAHSTGGLTVPLWLARRTTPEAAGLVLNSPWLDLHGPGILRHPVGKQLVRQLSVRQPLREITRNVSGIYGRSLHHEHRGEWDYDLTWKPLTSWPINFGWLGAIRRGHETLHAGLDLTMPALVLTSATSGVPLDEDDEVVLGTDIVLDVAQIRQWSPAVARHVTIASVEGAMHDVVLSRPDVRARVYDELDRWHAAYVGA